MQNQDKAKYDPRTITALEVSLSTDRLSSYVVMASGNKSNAVLLHEQNTEMAEALFGVIQGLEISFRNTVHRSLAAGIGHVDWYDHIALKSPEADALRFAKDTISRRQKPLAPPQIIAQLNFGFWVRLTSGDYEKPLWVPHLYKLFPAKTRRSKLNQRLNKIKDLRNKIAHHERILSRDLNRDYSQIMEIITWICPVTANWVRTSNRFERRSSKSSSSGLVQRVWRFVFGIWKTAF